MIWHRKQTALFSLTPFQK